MPKRFTDTEKWKKPFIRSLEAPYKLLWFYLLDDCDYAGIWQVDWDIARIKIGCEVKPEEALRQFDDRIVVFDDGLKWFIPDFIEFQYGKLNPGNRAHKAVLLQLEKYSLTQKPLLTPLQGRKDKEKEKEKDKEKEGSQKRRFKPPTYDEFLAYCKENGFEHIAERAFKGYAENDWHDGRGKAIKSWKGKLQHVWFNEEKNPKPKEETLYEIDPAKKAEADALLEGLTIDGD